MALLIRGKTTCGLCSKVIGEDDEVFAVPPLITNTLDPLYKFNDQIFLAECTKGNTDFEKLGRLIALWEERSTGKISFLSGNPITSPEDFFAFPYLGEEPQLKELNFQVGSKSDLREWPELPNIIESLEALQSSGAWGGDALAKIITELRKLVV